MPNDLYDDGGVAEEPAAASPPEKESSNDEGAAEALLPKEFFGGKELKPGSRCEIEIVRVTDDQVIARKVPESEYRDTEDETPAPESAMSDMMD